MAQEHPVAAGFGTGLGVLSEIGGLGKVPAKAALPIMGAGHSETSFLEPAEKGKELRKDFLTGLVLDKFFGSMIKLAKVRANVTNAQKISKISKA